MIVLLMILYPRLSMREMVGTDLVQAIPLVASAAIGHLIFAVMFAITIIGLPFAWAHLKLAGASLAPVGKEVVPRSAPPRLRGYP